MFAFHVGYLSRFQLIVTLALSVVRVGISYRLLLGSYYLNRVLNPLGRKSLHVFTVQTEMTVKKSVFEVFEYVIRERTSSARYKVNHKLGTVFIFIVLTLNQHEQRALTKLTRSIYVICT